MIASLAGRGAAGDDVGVSRSELIQHIESLSDEELQVVEPFLRADLEALPGLNELLDEVARGQLSARTEPLLEDDEVLQAVQGRLQRPR